MPKIDTETMNAALESIAALLSKVGLNNYCIIASDGTGNTYTTLYQIDSDLFVDACIEAVEGIVDIVDNSPSPTLH